MKAFVRFLAGFFFLVAVIFAVYDTTVTRTGGHGGFVSLYDTWSAVSPTSLKSAQTGVQRSTHPLVWSWGIVKVLQMPGWALLGLVGLALAYAGRRRRSINVYAN
jgi:MYXO-CTERM domain-containing protein